MAVGNSWSGADFSGREQLVASDDPMMASVAGRYASALYELAKEQGQLQGVEADLATVQALLDESADLRRTVRSPVISADAQGKALAAVLARARVGGLAANFVQLIARNRRLFALADMLKAFRQIAARNRGETSAEVTSAEPLSQGQLAQLTDALRASVGGKPVVVATKVDPSILGGLIVKMGSRMVDNSLRTKLNNLRLVMKEVR